MKVWVLFLLLRQTIPLRISVINQDNLEIRHHEELRREDLLLQHRLLEAYDYPLSNDYY